MDDKDAPGRFAKGTSPADEDLCHGRTLEMSRETFFGEFPVKQYAHLQIIGYGDADRTIELAEEDVVIGRSPDCGIRISINNVSRRHARVFLSNEEYHIEDLGSTNGTYVNGIKAVKCILRNNDHIEIGGVKILFTESKSFYETADDNSR